MYASLRACAWRCLRGAERIERFTPNWQPHGSLRRRYLHVRRETRPKQDIRAPLPRRRSNAPAQVVDSGMSVALVGRPNVGKSTIFNQLLDRPAARGRRAIVHALPGVTRDVTPGAAVLHDTRFTLLDTAGLEEHVRSTRRRPSVPGFVAGGDSVASLIAMDESELYRALYKGMAVRTARAVEEADVAMFVVDAQDGLTEIDRQLSLWLRSVKAREDIIYVANKCEAGAAQRNQYDFYELGLGEPLTISASHGLGKADLYLSLSEAFERKRRQKEERSVAKDTVKDSSASEAVSGSGRPEKSAEERKNAADDDVSIAMPRSDLEKLAADDEQRTVLITVVGRPNVGKSTLVNRLIGKEVCLTGPAPGVTRDAVPIDHTWKGKQVTLVDTAGMRRRSATANQVEEKSIEATLRAVRGSHVSILVMDARETWTRQEIQIAQTVLDEGRAILLALNKWDLVRADERKNTLSVIRDRTQNLFPALRNMQHVPISALHARRQFDLLDTACEIHDRWSMYCKTVDLNRWLTEFKKLVPIPARKGGAKGAKQFNLLFVSQTKARPPTFTFRGATAAQIPGTYIRSLENGLRKEFDWQGVPIRLRFLPRERTERSERKSRPSAAPPTTRGAPASSPQQNELDGAMDELSKSPALSMRAPRAPRRRKSLRS